jgi:23S rRNA pseudouridine2605 synthase
VPPERSGGVRLQKILSEAGIASRRKAEELITQGRVTVNGRVARLGQRADAAADDIRVDGKPIRVPESKTYLALNKPAGMVTTTSDPRGRRTVMDLVDVAAPVFPVGRLDMATEGLLLLTDDGELANRLLHPSHGVEKTYVAEVKGVVAREAIRLIGAGISIDEGRPAAAEVRVLDVSRRGKGSTVLEVRIHEGRKHVVRRLLEEVGHPVSRLMRTAFGPIRLGRLGSGSYRNLTPDEVASLYREAGL